RSRRESRFDLLDEDLLSAGVDSLRFTAQQFDGAVLEVTRAIARHRIAHAVDDRDGRGRLGLVTLVPQWDVTTLSEPTHAVVARLEDCAEVLGCYEGIRTCVEQARRHRARR